MREMLLGQGAQSLRGQVYETPESMADDVAALVLNGVAAARTAGQRYLLGCPGGRTPALSYRAIGRLAAARGMDCSNVTIVMMDDYVVPAGSGFTHCPADAHYSCRRFAKEDILNVINAGLPAGRRIPSGQVWFPDPANPAAYDPRLREAGGIDLFITASGASDGHVAFNGPCSAVDSTSRIVPLPDTTRRDNIRTFPEFRSLDEVPRHGVTIGLGSIRMLSRQVILLIHGADKREALRRLHACRGFDPQWPASFIYECPNPRVFLDAAASSGLSHGSAA